jgi:hypothetical protein
MHPKTKRELTDPFIPCKKTSGTTSSSPPPSSSLQDDVDDDDVSRLPVDDTVIGSALVLAAFKNDEDDNEVENVRCRKLLS